MPRKPDARKAAHIHAQLLHLFQTRIDHIDMQHARFLIQGSGSLNRCRAFKARVLVHVIDHIAGHIIYVALRFAVQRHAFRRPDQTRKRIMGRAFPRMLAVRAAQIAQSAGGASDLDAVRMPEQHKQGAHGAQHPEHLR